MWRILSIVNRPHLKGQIQKALGDTPFSHSFAEDLKTALDLLDKEMFHVVLADEELLGDHLKSLVLTLCENGESGIPLVLISSFRRGYTSILVDDAVPWTMVKRPLHPAVLKNTVLAMLDQVRLHHNIAYRRFQNRNVASFMNVLGACPSMHDVLEHYQKVAAKTSNVVITGEVGTGKDLLAAAIHYNSPRAMGNFVNVNCSTKKDSFFESELFGYKKGGATGPNHLRMGNMELANGGTLFLREVADLSLSSQAKVIRAIRVHEYIRLGGRKKIRSNFRLVCSSRLKLEDLVEQGKFREDLFYAINAFPIHIPPLRERKEDIPALARYYLLKVGGALGRGGLDFSRDTSEYLSEYDWPGNLRELENVIERAVLLCTQNRIQPEHIILDARHARPKQNMKLMETDKLNISDMERRVVIEALERANGVQKDAARILGISPRVMNYKIQKLKISSRDFDKS